MMSAETRLKAIELRIAKQVCSVHGWVTAEEIELRDSLRKEVGKSWDAINQTWDNLEGGGS